MKTHNSICVLFTLSIILLSIFMVPSSLLAFQKGDGYKLADRLIETGRFEKKLYHMKTFTLYGLLRKGTKPTLRVYIEGDGHAWNSRTEPSDDPTPYNPVALRLAMKDSTADTVLYLARPCQFTQGDEQRNCHVYYWTDARLGEAVIGDLNMAIHEAKKAAGAKDVRLIGFSGGGGAAVLIAARRNDVSHITTVAGNLNSSAWTRYQKVTPLVNSLEPFNTASVLRHIPQVHISGGKDTVIPPFISQEFCREAGEKALCLTAPDLSHAGPWDGPIRVPEGAKKLQEHAQGVSKKPSLNNAAKEAAKSIEP